MKIVPVFLLVLLGMNLAAQELSDQEFKLIQAAETGKSSEVLALLDQGVNPNCYSWMDEMTPLHYAVQNGHLTAAKILVLNKAKVNATDISRRSPLLLAVHFNHLDLAEFLIQNGADPNIPDQDGLTPLFYAAAYGDYFMTDMFLFYGGEQDLRDADGRNPFMASIWGGFPHVAALLIQDGADVQSTDASGRNALFLAIQNRDTVSVDSLINWGISINHQTPRRQTPLTQALRQKDLFFAEKLLQNGANPNHEITPGFNTLDYARAIQAGPAVDSLLRAYGAEEVQGIHLKHLELGIISRFNSTDARIGTVFQWTDLRKQFGVYLGVLQRPGRIKVLHPLNDSTDYLFRETRTQFIAGAEKTLPMVRLPNGSQWGFQLSADAGISFGDFKASSLTPPVALSFNPHAGLYFDDTHIRYQAGFLYQMNSLRYLPKGLLTVSIYINLTPTPFQ